MEQIVRRCRALVEAEVDGELVALDVDAGQCYGFNRTATRIWELIEEPMRVTQVRGALLKEFEVSEEECDEQLSELLNFLQQKGLITLEAVASS